MKAEGGFIIKAITRKSFLIGGVVISLSYLLFETKFIRVKEYTLKVNKLPKSFDGFTILHLSDLHSKWYGNHQSGLLDIIKGLRYDIIAFTGDLDSKDDPDIEPGLALVKGLLDKPVYFVPGNHDWWTGYRFRQALINMGVVVLENKAERYSKLGENIWIVGVDDPFMGRDNLDSALESVLNEMPKILLAHAPEIYSSAVKANIDVVLVGHTHGGQVRLPFIGAVVVPGQGLFPKLDYGLYNANNTQMIINAGLGESVLPIRVNIRPELVLITLKPA